MKVVSHSDARRSGAKLFFTGIPCLRGHVSERRTSNSDCLECSRVRLRDWYTANRDADVVRRAKFRKDNLDREKATQAANYKKNRAACKARSKANYHAKSDKISKWRKENRPLLAAALSDWRRRNPEKFIAYYQNRRALKKGAAGSHSASDIRDIAHRQRHKCAWCRVSLKSVTRHVDHIEPLSRGGSNHRSNLQLLCESCNCSKGAKDPLDFARLDGRLL